MAGERTAFFYGTLMVPDILYRVIWGNPQPPAAQKALLTIRPALLHGYKRHRVRHADFPAILPLSPDEAERAAAAGGGGDDDGVRGTVVTGLTAANVARLDQFEGSMYESHAVRAAVLDRAGAETGETVACETYVWVLDRDNLEPGEWDFADFMKEKAASWIGVRRDDYDDADALSDDDDEEVAAPPSKSEAKAPVPKKGPAASEKKEGADDSAWEKDEPWKSAV